jgi:hypothetical protein
MVNEPAEALERLAFDSLIIVGHDGGPELPDFGDYLAYMEETTAWLGLVPRQMLSIWYDWHANEFDVHLPEHMPPKPGFGATVQQAVTAGYRVMPYTTPTSWEMTLPSYADLDVAVAGIYDRFGQPFTYEHVAGHVQHALDFTEPFAEDHLSSYLYEPLYTDHNVSGIYLDFFPNPISVDNGIYKYPRCFAEDHGHEPGSAASVQSGIRRFLEMLGELGEQHGGGAQIITENLADYLIDHVATSNCYRHENFYSINDGRFGHIPLFDAVFRDITQMQTLSIVDAPGIDLYADARAAPGSMPSVRLAIGMTMGWAFAAGHNQAIIRRPIPALTPGGATIETLRDDPDFGDLMEVFKNLTRIRARPDVKDIIVFGRMAVPPEITTRTYQNLAGIDMVLPEAAGAVPHVFVYGFKNAAGNLAFTLFNWTGEPQSIAFNIHPDVYGMETDANGLVDRWRVTVHNANGSAVITENLDERRDWLAPDIDALPSLQPWVILFEKQAP